MSKPFVFRIQDTGRITLFRARGGWHAQFSGDVSETIRRAFNTDIIPLGFTAEAPAKQVQQEIQAKWARCIVTVQEAQ